MSRLTRAQTQERTCVAVLRAARDEFAEYGFRDAKIDRIAERAELTRGAVYSNFTGKRSLYFAVLADQAERETGSSRRRPAPDVRQALGAFARAWLARLPLATGHAAWLGKDLLAEITADERVRRPFAELMALDAILLGLALERLQGPEPARLVPTAELALTILSGASQLAATAPGFVEPFHVVHACEQLADLDLAAPWQPPHLAHVPKARPADQPWPAGTATDALHGDPVPLGDDGVVAVLGLHRLSAIEEAVRAAPSDAAVTAVLVTGADGELRPLVRLVLADLRDGLWHAVPERARPRLRLVYDGSGELAAAAGISAVSDATEAAVRIRGGRIAARADGRGACHAAASARPGEG
ncbi:TetR/AcrR family transcriptional regulator [Actinocatenispora sera]|uniref:TetR/AcrR family transcriptional regulator n=1 Tax=Actinocatenispora sera TaxID=390989 RepID=UPI0033EEAECD